MTPLVQYIQATGCEAAQAMILARALPCFHVFADGDASQAPLGRTRLGGTPDLPAGVDWPRDDEGKLGNFFGQLDLADLAQRVNDPALPREGLLSLFMTWYMSAGGETTLVLLPGMDGTGALVEPFVNAITASGYQRPHRS